jgi:hypothetical protein
LLNGSGFSVYRESKRSVLINAGKDRISNAGKRILFGSGIQHSNQLSGKTGLGQNTVFAVRYKPRITDGKLVTPGVGHSSEFFW